MTDQLAALTAEDQTRAASALMQHLGPEDAGRITRDAFPAPPVVTLCGSTRFRDEFLAAARNLTLAGEIVLMPGVFGHADGITLDEETKRGLDALHLRKIDLSKSIFVVNPGGYIGDSTRAEIQYAEATGKPVYYLEQAAT